MSWISLLPRDPDWAHALWSADGRGIARAESELGPGAGDVQLVARVYMTPGSAGGGRKTDVREVALERWSGSRVVLLGPPGSRHQAVLGLRDESGRFAVICRSEPMESSRSRRGSASADKVVRVTLPAAALSGSHAAVPESGFRPPQLLEES